MKSKILIVTSSYDITADYMIKKYQNSSDFYRFNTDYFQEYEIRVTESFGWEIQNKYWTIKESELTSIYYRKPSLPNLDSYEPLYHGMMQKEMLSLLKGLIDSFEGICLTRPSILNNAENKILQLKLASQIGFLLPKSLITNSNGHARMFCLGQESIIKPISVGKIYHGNHASIVQTNLVTMTDEIRDLELSPAYFQEYLQKDYEIRTTIIGDSIFSVRIDSQDKVDWRKKNSNNRYTTYNLPIELQKKCYTLLEQLGLVFGAFDFIVRDGFYYFLEVNPNGQWYWLEKELGLRISDSIISYLMGE